MNVSTKRGTNICNSLKKFETVDAKGHKEKLIRPIVDAGNWNNDST
ncbi:MULTISPECIES: hypothetical protein [Bacillus]|nr:hypothetical protein [Bacillus toyonensis]MCU5176866.1 hypothetical protein [Bacillus toyonensis]HDR7466252.1 hypothetical protein [Bacillus toyonensis]